MKIEDIRLKQDQLLNKLKALKAMGQTNAKRAHDLAEQAKDARIHGDYDAMDKVVNDMHSVMKMRAFIDKMFNDTLSELRAFMLTMYGPAGAMLWDALIKQIEEASD